MTLSCLSRENAPDLAYVYIEASGDGKDLPAVMFLGGFKSDMEGTKALYLEEQCIERGQAFIRFDYRGHGQSDGKFEEGTISLWKQDALDILDHLVKRNVILVGSSMGGWIALLLLLERPEKIAGMIGLAAAPDFTVGFYNDTFSDEQREKLAQDGYVELPNDYSNEPYIITKELIDDGNNNLFLDRRQNLNMPIHLIQGMQDTDVPWQTAHRIKNTINGDVEVTLIETGDHRLSRERDLELIDEKVRELSGLED